MTMDVGVREADANGHVGGELPTAAGGADGRGRLPSGVRGWRKMRP